MYIGQDGICMGYTLYIPGIYRKSGFQMVHNGDGLLFQVSGTRTTVIGLPARWLLSWPELRLDADGSS